MAILGGKGALEAVNNTPVYAKLPLMHAGGALSVLESIAVEYW